MASKKNARTNNAQRRRREMENLKFRIEYFHEPRTLKRAARKELERERAPQLWIYPFKDLGHSAGRIYSRASLLGLPTELRQQILYMSYPMVELERDLSAFILTRKRKNQLKWASTSEPVRVIKMEQHLRIKFGLNDHEADVVAVISRRIGALSLISPLIAREVKYVCAQWKGDLDKHLGHELHLCLDAPRFPIVPEGMEWLLTPSFTTPPSKKKTGKVVQATKLNETKKRPMKCWHCTERHFGKDPVCPMARSDPEKWQKMTKKLGGRRGKVDVIPKLRPSHVAFND
ncbi:hypothetical protein HBH56_016250 [Parastagonospora nodorum]|uniref:Uncharacterized protein n=2 Tax=Phaeosphaeria nodorum (strain SN15 / ATCC MYA-4574 / FGSC 10173) TaxID=321614 RepID=A0A7U2HYJ6_PHANO|nr:hypothetical protein SNOG_02812 [Parastagonospora nodorum SN15]KAH3919583.1 hypothetical protein HBH56_016250 [Parastagonospora nodorum]EAT89543.2 hypothetical protein SNOG_02812 [Parastagonospora nodorum SN15]KAH3937351.1 hypothetical protein HBH54_018210 [Parastagonospora nodorum]KAH3990339.1 hypothetical protein HBH52_007580 [Parastagonospora nodorum]KAH4134332.1 hypothetical protein HBH45_164940 [Parastagonospora nodorum]